MPQDSKPKILIVDDEAEIGNLLTLYLEDDFDVVTFTDPRTARDEITKNAYDLVISDIKMPYLTGLELLKIIKSVRPKMHVVLMTGHAQTERDRAEAENLGAVGILFKPFGDPKNLLDYLHNTLAGK